MTGGIYEALDGSYAMTCVRAQAQQRLLRIAPRSPVNGATFGKIDVIGNIGTAMGMTIIATNHEDGGITAGGGVASKTHGNL